MIEHPEQEDYDLKELLSETRAVVERIHEQSKHLNLLVQLIEDTFDKDQCAQLNEELHSRVEESSRRSTDMEGS